MIARPLLAAVAATAVLLLASQGVFAGAPTPPFRAADVENICKGGERRGETCNPSSEPTECPGGSCEIVFVTKPVTGILTIISDDFVLDWAATADLGPQPGSGVVGGQNALTVMLEIRVNGQPHMIVETYQNNADVFSDPSIDAAVVASGPINEALLEAATDPTNFDALANLENARAEGSTMGPAVCALLGAPANAVALITDFTGKVASTIHAGDNLGSVLRSKVKIRCSTLLPP